MKNISDLSFVFRPVCNFLMSSHLLFCFVLILLGLISATPNFGGTSSQWVRKTKTSEYNSQGCRVDVETTEASDVDGVLSNRVTRYDFLGRVCSVTTPTGTTSNFYAQGLTRLVRTEKNGVRTDILYDELGSKIGTRMNNIDILSVEGYQEIGGYWWKAITEVTRNAALSVTTSVSLIQMTGLGVPAPRLVSLSPSRQIELPASAIMRGREETRNRHNELEQRTTTYFDQPSATEWKVIEGGNPDGDKSVIISRCGYPIEVITSGNVTNRFMFDGFARLSSIIDGRGNPMLLTYDAHDQLVSKTVPVSNTTFYAHDSFGRVVAETNATGGVRYSIFDGNGNLTAQWGTEYPVAYQYDTASRKIWQATTRNPTYAKVNLHTVPETELDITQWNYDYVTGLLTNKVYADGSIVSYFYDQEGKIRYRIWARGVETTYNYTESGLLQSIIYSDDTPSVTFMYDGLNRLISVNSAVSTNMFEWDGFDLVGETQNGVNIQRRYDVNRRLTVLTIDEERSMLYRRGNDGRLDQVVAVSDQITATNYYSYVNGTDMVRSIVTVLAPSGNNTVRTQILAPANDWISVVSNTFNQPTTPISTFSYEHDKCGKIVAMVDGVSGKDTRVFYNDVGELTGVSNLQYSACVAYTPVGGRAYTIINGQTNTYMGNSLNQYTQILSSVGLSRHFVYDSDGNTTFDGVYTYFYDAENRPTCVSNAFNVMRFSYDYRDRMIRKDVSVLSENGLSDYSVFYTWDEWNIIQERVVSNNQSRISSYIWGLDISGTLQGAGGIGGMLLAVIDGEPFLPCYDAIGNVTEYCNAEGSVVARREYTPFGETCSVSGELANRFTFWWATKPFEPLTGTIQFEKRWYNPPTGSWFTRDSLEEEGGVNLYAFVKNSPLNAHDPIGQVIVVDDAAAVTAAYMALATAAAYLMTPQRQEHCRQVADSIAGGCACACDRVMQSSKDAYEKARKQLEVALTHFSYLGGSGHGKDPNDRWRNWNKWKSEIRTALDNAKKRAKNCTTKAKEEILRKTDELNDLLQKIDDLPRGGR